jgi:hypothetical protein
MVGRDKYSQRGLKEGIKVEAERDRGRGGKEAERNSGRHR